MKTAPNRVTSIRDKLGDESDCSGRLLWGATASVSLGDLVRGTSFGGRLLELSGRSVLLVTRDQLAAALALIELDGIARRIIIGTPDLSSQHLPSVIAKASVDAIVSDHDLGARGALGVPLQVVCNSAITRT